MTLQAGFPTIPSNKTNAAIQMDSRLACHQLKRRMYDSCLTALTPCGSESHWPLHHAKMCEIPQYRDG
jgi:hypothetical protein